MAKAKEYVLYRVSCTNAVFIKFSKSSLMRLKAAVMRV